jgi:acetate kinase
MGLTPLEGLIGGTRSGTIDPTAIFHHTPDCAEDSGLKGMKVTKAELVLNKCVLLLFASQASNVRCRKSGLQALAGTTNFGTIITRVTQPTSRPSEDYSAAKLAYAVYLDRLLSYISQYVFKLLSTVPLDQFDGIVFSGGIGEKGAELRRDALNAFEWLGAQVDEKRNGEKAGKVREITREGSKLRGWVVETDEEGWCAKLARDDFGF